MKSFNLSAVSPPHEYHRYDRKSLLPVFQPENIALIGGSEKPGSIGRVLVENLLNNPVRGKVFLVNPNRDELLGVKAYPSLGDLPEKVDLAVIATPAQSVPAVVDECIAAGLGGAVIISSGFREIGEQGAALERQIQQQARRANFRIVGPNCFGVMLPYSGLNASIAGAMPKPGKVGFVSQSGAIASAVLDWSFREQVGFSAFISMGNMVDIDWGDLISFLGDDHHTHSIVMYLESINDARSFISAARETALSKPIIVLKGGLQGQEIPAALTHSGELFSDQKVLNAAFRRCGILPVRRLVDLFAMAEVLAKQPPARSGNLTIISNSTGPAIRAMDALLADGGDLATLAPETESKLKQVLPPEWTPGNPVNLLRDADSDRYEETLKIVTEDPNSDGFLVILAPHPMNNPTATAERVSKFARLKNKPLLASWMGASETAAGKAYLNQHNIPTFPFPDTAVQVFNYLWKYSYNLRGLFETPHLPPDSLEFTPDRERVAELIDTARREQRTHLSTLEIKQILAAYGLPVLNTEVAVEEEQAVQMAGQIGYPVVLKLFSDTILHKSAIGGVHLNLASETGVRQAFRAIREAVHRNASDKDFRGVIIQPMLQRYGYELMAGVCPDPQFGPVLLFGAGGPLAKIHQDQAFALPPLNSTLARRMMEQTRIYKALSGEKGYKSVNIEQLEQFMVRFSQLVVEQRWIREVDINPLLASAEELSILDARIALYPPEHSLPRLAIRPYPAQYIQEWKLRDGAPVTIRPIRPEDEPLMAKFHQTLSDESVYLRYFHPVALKQRVAHERLARICFIDYDHEMVLVVEKDVPGSEEKEIIAVGRLNKLRGINDAEYAILISDGYQRSGIGTKLLSRLVEIGREEGIDRIVADILPENKGMIKASEKVGFTHRMDYDEQVVKAVIELQKTK